MRKRIRDPARTSKLYSLGTSKLPNILGTTIAGHRTAGLLRV